MAVPPPTSPSGDPAAALRVCGLTLALALARSRALGRWRRLLLAQEVLLLLLLPRCLQHRCRPFPG